MRNRRRSRSRSRIGVSNREGGNNNFIKTFLITLLSRRFSDLKRDFLVSYNVTEVALVSLNIRKPISVTRIIISFISVDFSFGRTGKIEPIS